MPYGNRPWHTLSDFETYTRFAVGTASSDDLPSAVWSESRNAAETEILSFLLDKPTRPIRAMLEMVSGELVPQIGAVRAAGNYVHTFMLPNVVTTPSQNAPYVWRNLDVKWFDRHRVTPLAEGTDYSISGNTLTITSANENDVFALEYYHTLDPVPDCLKYLSMDLTCKNLVINKFGVDQGMQQEWAGPYAEEVERKLSLLERGLMEIPEFARINLYKDWTEGEEGIRSIPFLRGG